MPIRHELIPQTSRHPGKQVNGSRTNQNTHRRSNVSCLSISLTFTFKEHLVVASCQHR